jgi:hypothetical protein
MGAFMGGPHPMQNLQILSQISDHSQMPWASNRLPGLIPTSFGMMQTGAAGFNQYPRKAMLPPRRAGESPMFVNPKQAIRITKMRQKKAERERKLGLLQTNL